MPILFGKPNIGKNNHDVRLLIDQGLKGRAVMDISGITAPDHNQPYVIVNVAQLTTPIQR